MVSNNDSKLERTKSSGNVFSDLGLPNAEKYLAKVELAHQINSIIKRRGFKQIKAAEELGIDQPKISDLSCGRLDGFSIERLISFLNKLHRDVEIVVKRKSRRRESYGHLSVALEESS